MSCVAAANAELHARMLEALERGFAAITDCQVSCESRRAGISTRITAIDAVIIHAVCSSLIRPARTAPRPPSTKRANTLLQPVSVGHKALGDYRHLIGRALVEEIQELAEPLKGKRVLHLSATAMGGGVSEILYALVPLMRDAGLETRLAHHPRPRGVLQRHEAACTTRFRATRTG